MAKLSAKTRMLNTLMQKDGYNTFSVRQAQNRFGITNVPARISELRQEGYPIYTNQKVRGDGSKVNVYRLGTPSKTFKARCRTAGVRVQSA